MSAILAIVILVGVGLLLAGSYGFRRGYEAGRREQRRIINRAMDDIRRQALSAQQGIDYLYERAQQEIRQRPGSGGVA